MKQSMIILVSLPLLFCALTAGAADVTLSFSGTQIAVEMGGFTRTPQGMQLTMTLDVGALTLPAGRRLVLTPVVKNRDEARSLPAIVVAGRKQYIDYLRKGDKTLGSDVTLLRRKNGTAQTLPYTATLPYEPWMENADVVLMQDVCGCGDLLGSDRLTLWRRRHPAVAYIRPMGSVETRTLEGSAFIDFPVNKITLYPAYGRNPEELSKLWHTLDKLKQDERITITHITLCGWASPETPYPHNARLARARAETLQRYVAGLLHLDDARFTLSSVPENWSGLRTLVQASDLPHKAAILALIDEEGLDPDVKEARIKAAYPDDYAFMLARFYPSLRRVDYTVTYTVRPFTVDEALSLWRHDPGRLSLEAFFLVAQEVEPGTAAFDALYDTAVRLFPDDPTVNLNAACAAITRGAWDAAEDCLSKAGDTAQAWNARGVLAAERGDMEAAAALFRQAAAMGLDTAAENLQLVTETY